MPVDQLDERVDGRSGPSRRSFLKWSAVAGGATALATSPVFFAGKPGHGPSNSAFAAEGAADAEATVWSACTVNCGSRCPLKLQVKDGQIFRVLSEDTGDNELGTQQIRACVRGRSIRHRIYNPDRLKTPLKRKEGTKRGDGEWEEISWEQALDEIADKMKELLDKYGNESIYLNYGTGTLAVQLPDPYAGADTVCATHEPAGWIPKSLCGLLDSPDHCGIPFHYGGWVASNSLDDAKNAKLQVMFGNNPLETRMSGGGELFVTQRVREENGTKTIIIDPRYSDSARASR